LRKLKAWVGRTDKQTKGQTDGVQYLMRSPWEGPIMTVNHRSVVFVHVLYTLNIVLYIARSRIVD